MQEKVEPAYTKGKVAFAKFRKGVSFKNLKQEFTTFIYLLLKITIDKKFLRITISGNR